MRSVLKKFSEVSILFFIFIFVDSKAQSNENNRLIDYLREFDKKVFGEKDFIGGNPWGGISADIKKGVVFLTTGNPKPNYVGTSRPGKNLFANSIIAFDIRNQKKIMAFSRNMS